MKRRFVIVGSGWRAMYYVRIAKALPEVFELCAMLCRTEEKAERIHNEMGIHTTTSIAECEAYQPDFVVVVVDKASIYKVSKEWMAKGFTVLCETPAEVEMAIAMLMEGAARYQKDGTELYPLADALQDAYMAILMREAIEHPGEVMQSEPQPWN